MHFSPRIRKNNIWFSLFFNSVTSERILVFWAADQFLDLTTHC